MKPRLAGAAWNIVKSTFDLWRRHRSAEMAAALAFYGSLALSGATLICIYVAAAVLGRHERAHAAGEVARASGPHNAQLVDFVLREAANRHDTWIALAAGSALFVFATAGTAFQLQLMLDVIWDTRPRQQKSESSGSRAERGAGFLAVYALALVLAVLLFAGAAIHGLTMHTRAVPIGTGLLYQSVDVAASIVVLTCVFLSMFAYLPPVDIPWRNVWIASVVSAILYERGQFALVVYLGQMDARSPYADAGALVAVLLWLYFSAQVVVIGAALTKVLHQQAAARSRQA